jgi:tetratricopeptide (TPR) repeat protein
LLERAAASGVDRPDLALEMDLLDALFWSGRLDDALARVEGLVHEASTAGDRTTELCCRLKGAVFHVWRSPASAARKLEALLRDALPLFRQVGDDVALSTAYAAMAQLHNVHAEMDAMGNAFERAAAHAQRAGRPYEFLPWRAAAQLEGTTPASEVVAWVETQHERGASHPGLERRRAIALAMLCRFDDARAALGELRAKRARPGMGLFPVWLGHWQMTIELLAGELEAAAELGLEALRAYHQAGGGSDTAAADLATMVGGVLSDQGDWERAGTTLDRAAQLAGSDRSAILSWLPVKARLLARLGEHDEARRLAREAVEIGEQTDMLNKAAATYAGLAEVLRRMGLEDESVSARREALTRYERKENLAMCRRLWAELES